MSRFGYIGISIVLLGLAGCVETTTSGSSGTPGTPAPSNLASSPSSQKTAAERNLEAEAKSLSKVTNDIIVRNTVEGAVIGALAGCGIALMLGGDGEDCAGGAVVGGLAGGVAGNQVGRAAASKNVELVNRDQVLANLRGVSTQLNSVEANLRTVVRAQNAEISSLNRQLAAGQISESSYKARVNSINSNRRTVDSALASSEQNIVKTRNEIRSAESQGQQGLASVESAAASTQERLARNRKLLTLVN
jgi:hypothetical protein